MEINDFFHGASLCEIIEKDNIIIKRYSGSIHRGYEKLQLEYEWYNNVATTIRKNHPDLFPICNLSKGQNYIELQIQKFKRKSLSKSILNKELSAEMAQKFLHISIENLLNILYKSGPTKIIDSKGGFLKYQNERICLAKEYLQEYDEFQPFFKSSNIIINGIPCPSVQTFLEWLNINCDNIYKSTHLSRIHGNFHLDNILIDNINEITSDSITFIDPRGDLYGFPHYDFAKLLLTLEGYYDEINYDLYTLETKMINDILKINLIIDTDFNDYYTKCIDKLIDFIPEFSKCEGVSDHDFLLMVYTTECIHILSLCFYHSNKFNSQLDYNKIYAFLAIFCLMAKRLMEMDLDEKPIKISKRRLKISLNIEKELEEIKETSNNFKNFIAIIGAGVSNEACLPTGNELTSKLKDHFKGIDSATNLAQAAFLIDDREGLQKLLCKTYDTDSEPTDAHVLLANLNLPCYVSLNFDELLERALEKLPKKVDKIINNKNIMIPYVNSTMVIKPHGTVSIPNSLHITSEETVDFFKENPIIANMLVSQLANKTLLFIGFSFSDPDFLGILRYLKKQSGKYVPKGYAIMNEKNRYQEKLCNEFNIKIIQSDATKFLIKLNETVQKSKQTIIPWQKYPLFFDQLQKGGIPTEIQIIKAITEKIKSRNKKNINVKMLKQESISSVEAVLKYRPLYTMIQELRVKLEAVNSKEEFDKFIEEFDKYDSNKIKEKAIETFNYNLTRIKKDISVDKIRILLYSRSQSVINFFKEFEKSIAFSENIELFISECGPRSILHYEDSISYIRQLQPTKFKITLLPDAMIFNLLNSNSFDLVFLGAHSVYKDTKTNELMWFTNTVGSAALVDFAKKNNTIVNVVFEDKKIHDKFNEKKLDKECLVDFNNEKEYYYDIASDILIPEGVKEDFYKQIKCLKLQHDMVNFEHDKVIPVIINYNSTEE